MWTLYSAPSNLLIATTSYSRYLVDWVATICERCDITSETLHLAITCLDHFMDKYSIEDTQLHLIALCCLLIAGLYLYWLIVYITYCNYIQYSLYMVSNFTDLLFT